MIINDPKVEVTRGEIEVNVVDRVLDTENAVAWHVDLRSKYARVSSYGQSGREANVSLAATEDTLYADEELRGHHTTIHLPAPFEWIVLAECAKYTCRIVAYRPIYKR